MTSDVKLMQFYTQSMQFTILDLQVFSLADSVLAA